MAWICGLFHFQIWSGNGIAGNYEQVLIAHPQLTDMARGGYMWGSTIFDPFAKL
jgi:hypothetical protein